MKLFAKTTSMIATLALVLTGFGSLYVAPAATAGTYVVASGRVYNGATGQNYSGVVVNLCNGITATTGADGRFQALVPFGGEYCARIQSGVPAGVSGPSTRNQPSLGARTTYEYQRAGVDCYHNSACGSGPYTWDRSYDDQTDFIYAKATPVPTPVATPTPTPVPATPTPGVTVSTPTDLTAALASSNQAVNLSWKAGTAGSTYLVERSVDQSQWTQVAANVTGTTTTDSSIQANVKYFYRVSAKNGGQTSGFATTEIRTPAVNGTTTTDVKVIGVTSSDGLAIAKLASGDIASDASCVVTNLGTPAQSPGKKSIADGYQLTCKTASGAQIDLSGKNVAWTLNLATLPSGYSHPKGLIYGTSKAASLANPSTYDAAKRTLAFSAPSLASVSAIATIASYAWVNFVIFGSIILAIVLAILFFPVRHHRRRTQRDYIRSKYYDL